MVSFDSYLMISESLKRCYEEFIDEISKEMRLYSPYLVKRQIIKKKKLKEHFNIFSSISDTYKKENYNSDILKLILDPNTEELGNPAYLELFLQFIGLNKNEINKYFSDLKSVQVLREKHRIDILLCNKKYAVIIESKINETIDQPNQLVRYYRRVTEDDCLNVVKVVYLTLIPSKYPRFVFDAENKTDGMSEESFEEYAAAIKTKLCCLSAVSDKEHDKGKTLKDFLERCTTISTSDLSKVVISQYAKLLEKTGGDTLMLEPERKLIQEIYSSRERIRSASDFAEVWEKKDEILTEIYFEKFKKDHKDWVLDMEDNTFYKEVIKDKLSLYYAPYCWWQLGFQADKIDKKKALYLQNIMGKLKHTDLSVSEINYEKPWVYIDFAYTDDPIDEFYGNIMKTLDELLEMSKNIKEI